ncbi:MAG: JAB domain-containing protein [Clostridia bacterium]|nr:JAB domain-containing protein [Clostridia bacterium]
MSKPSGLPEMLTIDARTSFERTLAISIGDEKSRECTARLLERYGSLMTVFSEREEEICRVGGVNMSTALLIKLIAYTHSRRVVEKFEFCKEHTELEIREFIAALFIGTSVETVYVLLLDGSDRVVSAEYISEGTVNTSDVLPRKILECANKKKSRKIILAHNHPKGTKTPSKDDIMTTGRLFNLFATVGVRLVSHYIVADGEVDRIEAEMLYNPDFRG